MDIRTLTLVCIGTLLTVGCDGAFAELDAKAFGDVATDTATYEIIGDTLEVAELPETSAEDTAKPSEPLTSPGLAYHEHGLYELPEGVHLNQDDTVALWLEHPDSSAANSKDTGATGVDELTFQYFYPHTHTFCWNGEKLDPPHVMTMADQDGTEVLRLEEGEGCKSVILNAGVYTKSFTHSGRGTEGELMFLQPVDSSATPVKLSPDLVKRAAPTGNPCMAAATLTHGTISQLQTGQIGLIDTCTPVAGTPVQVFNQACGNLLGTAGAPAINAKAIYAGPNTAAVIYSASSYSGYSMVATNSAGTPTCMDTGSFLNDLKWDQKMSFKVWSNDPATSNTCRITWAGPASALASTGPAEGEVWLYSEAARSGLAWILAGPCADLCNINASQFISSIWVGPNTVATLHKGTGYLGESFPYQHTNDALYDFDNTSQSIYVESVATYNNETTLIHMNNCDHCNLRGMRLEENENLAGASLDTADLTGARMVGVDLSNANAPSAIFKGANLAYANLKGATLSSAVFEGDDHTLAADLSYAYMPNVKLDHAHMNGVTADYAQIYGTNATVLQATMTGIHLSNAILCNMNFAQASMVGATMTGANLISASFLGADLTNANLVNASLQGTIFDGGKLYGAKLQNATIAFVAGSLSVTRLGDGDTLQTVSASFAPTSLPKDTTNANTFCPNGGQSDDGNAWCDTVTELTAPSPPNPPVCVPSLTNFCPRVKK